MDIWSRKGHVQRHHLPVNLLSLSFIVFRGYITFLYQLCAFASRYYLVWAVLILFFFPGAAVVILLMHIMTCMFEYAIKKPKIRLLAFIYYFSLDQLFYQLGVWWGCLKNRHFSPVNPRILWKKNL